MDLSIECTIFRVHDGALFDLYGNMFGHFSRSIVLEHYYAQDRRKLVASYISIDHDGAMHGLVLHTSYQEL